ncbi:WG repeat-containing protein [Taibaiella soli]|uniref:WG repeat-containing protein n=1 Tax=Taibaiella soli TaxID=1649169 RepID=A0A2W2ADV0_9BACT|nr:WG repeat-containing protein [Taibaiella soli]PZF73451.1 hypothetical protein DN068_07915 [Taibaiella soli]
MSVPSFLKFGFMGLMLLMGICVQVFAQEQKQYIIFDSTQSKTFTVYKRQLTPDRFWVCTTDYSACGILDANDRIVVPIRYHGLGLLHEGVLTACDSNNKYGYIDVNGRVIIPFYYKNTGDFGDRLAWVTDSTGAQYFIDHKGHRKFDAIYDACGAFNNGRSVVYKGNLRGYINRRGKVVIPLQYKEAASFKHNRARVLLGNEYLIINRNGKVKAHAGYWEPIPPL